MGICLRRNSVGICCRKAGRYLDLCEFVLIVEDPSPPEADQDNRSSKLHTRFVILNEQGLSCFLVLIVRRNEGSSCCLCLNVLLWVLCSVEDPSLALWMTSSFVGLGLRRLSANFRELCELSRIICFLPWFCASLELGLRGLLLTDFREFV